MGSITWKDIVIFVSVLFTGLQITGQSERFNFERISEKHDLLHGSILDIIEDHQGYIWFAAQEGVFRYDGYDFKSFRHDVTDTTSLSHPYSRCIFEDSKNNLWIGTTYGLNLYIPKTASFKRFLPFPEVGTKNKLGNSVRHIAEDQSGTMWLATNYGIVGFDTDSMAFIYPENKTANPVGSIRNIHVDENNVIWASSFSGIYRMEDHVVTEKRNVTNPNASNSSLYGIVDGPNNKKWIRSSRGLFEWDPATNKASEISILSSNNSSQVYSVIEDLNGIFWVGTRNGLLQFSLENDELEIYKHDENHSGSLIENQIGALLIDRFNILWIGTINGICKLDLNQTSFKFFQNQPGTEHPSNKIFRILQDQNDLIWTQTADGLYKQKIGSHLGEKVFILGEGTPNYTVQNLVEDAKGQLWVAIRGRGLFVKAKDSDSFVQFKTKPTLQRININKIDPDNKDPETIWLGTSVGFCKLNSSTGVAEFFAPKDQIPDLPNNRMIIFQEGDGDKIWLYYTFYNRLGSFDKKSGVFEVYEPSKEQAIYLEGDIHDMEYCSDGKIRIATLYGLTTFDTKTKEFSILTKKDGFLESELNIVIEDNDKNLWVCGYQFISHYNPKTKEFLNHYPSPKVKSFYSRSKTKGQSGLIFLGGKNGFHSVNPNQLVNTTRAPDIVLNDFKVSNESLFIDDVENLSLDHNQNDISFEFAGLHFINPESNRYKCRLEGYDEEWQEIDNDRKISYTNLDPGDYQFQLHASNSDGLWTRIPYTLNFEIAPPFWKTMWFRGLIVLLLGAIGYIVYRNRLHQQFLKKEKELAERTAEYKMNFLANVSHEIRTPMTSIKAITELINDTKLNEKQKNYINTIQQSSGHLVKIINDLLDFSKLEANKFTFAKHHFNIGELASEVESVLKHHEKSKPIKIRTEIKDQVHQWVEGDELRLYQVLINLMGNAIKFTEKGSIDLLVSVPSNGNGQFLFEVIDTGVGIPETHLENIFEDYTQAYENRSKQFKGTGLGLSISKKLIERQGGSMNIESHVGSGTKVYFTLPLIPIEKPLQKELDWIPPDVGNINILIVEDNELNSMLISELLKKYVPDGKSFIAKNGEEAVAKCKEFDFDIILMDLKMPVMNGFDATKNIRSLPKSSVNRTPILGLTANLSEAQKEKCIAAGMDDCIFKPIDTPLLLDKIYQYTRIEQ